MEGMNGQPSVPVPPTLFNSDVETGIRTLIILDALHPRRCNILELMWFDYAVVNSGQFESGPPSLHPMTDVNTGELLVRRHSIQRGLNLLRRMHLADERHDDTGVTFSAGEEAPSFLDRLEAAYHQSLKDRAIWLMEAFGAKSADQIGADIETAIGRWTAHLQTESFSAGIQP